MKAQSLFGLAAQRGLLAILSSGCTATVTGSDARQTFDAVDGSAQDTGEFDSEDAGSIESGLRSEYCPGSSCSGTPSGSWTFETQCGDGLFDQTRRGCPDLLLQLSENRASGSLQLNADGSYEKRLTRTIRGSFSVSSACYVPLGGCAVYGRSLNPRGGCREVGTTCTCTISTDGTSLSVGQFTLSPTELILQNQSGEQEGYEFCLSPLDDQLWLHLTSPVSGPESYSLRR